MVRCADREGSRLTSLPARLLIIIAAAALAMAAGAGCEAEDRGADGARPPQPDAPTIAPSQGQNAESRRDEKAERSSKQNRERADGTQRDNELRPRAATEVDAPQQAPAAESGTSKHDDARSSRASPQAGQVSELKGGSGSSRPPRDGPQG